MEKYLYSVIYTLCISQSAQACITQLYLQFIHHAAFPSQAFTSCADKNVLLFEFLASAHVKQAVLLIAYDEA